MSLASLPVAHPSWVYLTLAPALALGALSPAPSFVPLVLLLAILRLHASTILPRRQWRNGVYQILLLSLAVAIVHAGPSLHALSTPFVSIIVIAGLSTITTSIAAATLLAGFYAKRASRTPWMHATVFPALWASVWAAVEYCSPVGQLATWSPVTQVGGYAWLRPYMGQVAINWVVAAWSVVVADLLEAWIMGSGEDDKAGEPGPLVEVMDEENVLDPAPKISGRSKTTLLLAGALLLLATPSYFADASPPPVVGADVTSFGVACALPYLQKNGKLLGPPTLEHYFAESKTLQSQAKVVLWPESAVHFLSPDDREKAFEKMRPSIANGTYWAIGFEELMHKDSEDGVWKAGMRRNGLVLLGWEGVVYEYYKRHLVPIAESFSMTPANEKPSLFTMDLPAPRGWTRPKWAPAPNFTRPLALTASICLDFATSASLTELPARPALVLAPARTWHPSVGRAMWEQAKARAEEAGSLVLWCDGGAGGVSGVAGRGLGAFRQAGPGSWAQTVSVPWPFDGRRTAFAAVGTGPAVAAVWGVVGVGWMVAGAGRRVFEVGEYAFAWKAVGFAQNIGVFVRRLVRGDRRGEEQPLLA